LNYQVPSTWTRSSGVAALNGGNAGVFNGTTSWSIASFDDVRVGTPESGGMGGTNAVNTQSLGLGAAGAGDVGIVLFPVASADSPSGSGTETDLIELTWDRQRGRRRWDGIRLS
jgi:hypothetical protein